MDNFKTGISIGLIAFFIAAFSGTIYADSELRCGGATVRVGQTIDQVKNTLGEPVWIDFGQDTPEDQSYSGDQNEPTVNITKMTYQCGSRTYVLIFRNELLMTVRQTTATDKNTEENYTE